MPSYHAACVKFRVSRMICQRYTMSCWTGTTFLQPHPANTILLHFLFVSMKHSSSKLKQFKMPPLLLLQIGLWLSMASKASCFWVAWPLCLSQLHFLTTSCILSGPTLFPTHPPVDRKIQRSWASRWRLSTSEECMRSSQSSDGCYRWYCTSFIQGLTSQSCFEWIPRNRQNVFYLDHVLRTYFTMLLVSKTTILYIFSIWFACSSFARNLN